MEKDIISRFNISYKSTFREMAMTMIGNAGKYVSYNKIKNDFGLKSDHTSKNYLSYLEESYLILQLKKFSFKPKEVEKSVKKTYCIDTGMINHVSSRVFFTFIAFITRSLVLIFALSVRMMPTLVMTNH